MNLSDPDIQRLSAENSRLREENTELRGKVHALKNRNFKPNGARARIVLKALEGTSNPEYALTRDQVYEKCHDMTKAQVSTSLANLERQNKVASTRPVEQPDGTYTRVRFFLKGAWL